MNAPFIDAHEEIMRKAAELQGCPVVGPLSMEGRKQQRVI